MAENIIELLQNLKNDIAYIIFDSMGPLRDPIEDRLIPGVGKALYNLFMVKPANVVIGVATNGPKKETLDVLVSLVGGTSLNTYPVKETTIDTSVGQLKGYISTKKGKNIYNAFGVAEGGGLLSFYYQGYYFDLLLVKEQDKTLLNRLEQEVRKDPLIRFMLDNYKTDYYTNLVITLPLSFEEFKTNFENQKCKYNFSTNIEDMINEWGRDYLDINNKKSKAIEYFLNIIVEAEKKLKINTKKITKVYNRRVYVHPSKLINGREFNKLNGIKLGSQILVELGVVNKQYKLENSIYVADRLNPTNPAEWCMVYDKLNNKAALFGINVISQHKKVRSEYQRPLILDVPNGLIAIEYLRKIYS